MGDRLSLWLSYLVLLVIWGGHWGTWDQGSTPGLWVGSLSSILWKSLLQVPSEGGCCLAWCHSFKKSPGKIYGTVKIPFFSPILYKSCYPEAIYVISFVTESLIQLFCPSALSHWCFCVLSLDLNTSGWVEASETYFMIPHDPQNLPFLHLFKEPPQTYCDLAWGQGANSHGWNDGDQMEYAGDTCSKGPAVWLM